MIIEWLMRVGTGFASWVVSIFPTLDLPEGIVNLDDHITSVLALGAGTGVFIDWTYIGFVAAIPLSVWALGLLVKAVRALVAHIPFVGGKG